MMKKIMVVCIAAVMSLAACKSKEAEMTEEAKPQENADSVANSEETKADDKPQLDADAVKQLSVYVAQKREEYGVPGMAVGIVKDGAVVYSNSFGSTRLKDGKDITSATMFNIRLQRIFETEPAVAPFSVEVFKAAGEDFAESAPENAAMPHGRTLSGACRRISG